MSSYAGLVTRLCGPITGNAVSREQNHRFAPWPPELQTIPVCRTGYGHRTARHRCMSRSEVEDVRMTRPVTIPGPGRQMGRAALLLPLPTACPAGGSPSSAGCTPRAQSCARVLETEQNDAPERRLSPSLPQRRTAHPVCPRMASTLGIRRLGPGRERGDRARSIWAQSPGHDDSVAIVHAVQPQQIAVLSGPQARLEIATKPSDSRLYEFRRQRRERRAGRPDSWI